MVSLLLERYFILLICKHSSDLILSCGFNMQNTSLHAVSHTKWTFSHLLKSICLRVFLPTVRGLVGCNEKDVGNKRNCPSEAIMFTVLSSNIHC